MTVKDSLNVIDVNPVSATVLASVKLHHGIKAQI